MSYNSLHLISLPGKGIPQCLFTFNQLKKKAYMHWGIRDQNPCNIIRKGLVGNRQRYKTI